MVNHPHRSKTNAKQHEIEDLFLYAVNTGELYATHCHLARENAQLEDWFVHAGKVVKRYQREISMAYRPSDASIKWDVAVKLRDYYAQHMKEF